MKLHRYATSKRRRTRALVTVTLTIATALGALAATTGAASASGYTVVPGTVARTINATYLSNMNVAVSGGGNYAGAPIIQWYPDNGSEQNWYFDEVYDPNGNDLGFFIRNQNSGECIDTDGVAGDQLVQTNCVPTDNGQIFTERYISAGNLGGWVFTNRGTGLVLDVYGNSYTQGSAIDLWPWKGVGTSNQIFVVH